MKFVRCGWNLEPELRAAREHPEKSPSLLLSAKVCAGRANFSERGSPGLPLSSTGRGNEGARCIDMGNTLNTHIGNTSIFAGRSPNSKKNCYTLRRKPLKAQLAGFAT